MFSYTLNNLFKKWLQIFQIYFLCTQNYNVYKLDEYIYEYLRTH